MVLSRLWIPARNVAAWGGLLCAIFITGCAHGALRTRAESSSGDRARRLQILAYVRGEYGASESDFNRLRSDLRRQGATEGQLKQLVSDSPDNLDEWMSVAQANGATEEDVSNALSLSGMLADTQANWEASSDSDDSDVAQIIGIACVAVLAAAVVAAICSKSGDTKSSPVSSAGKRVVTSTSRNTSSGSSHSVMAIPRFTGNASGAVVVPIVINSSAARARAALVERSRGDSGRVQVSTAPTGRDVVVASTGRSNGDRGGRTTTGYLVVPDPVVAVDVDVAGPDVVSPRPDDLPLPEPASQIAPPSNQVPVTAPSPATLVYDGPAKTQCAALLGAVGAWSCPDRAPKVPLPAQECRRDATLVTAIRACWAAECGAQAGQANSSAMTPAETGEMALDSFKQADDDCHPPADLPPQTNCALQDLYPCAAH